MGASMPAARIRATLSRRESASIVQPPASMARAMSGSPQQHLVAPATSMPCAAQSCVTASALARMRSQSTSILMARRSSLRERCGGRGAALTRYCTTAETGGATWDRARLRPDGP